MSDSPKQTTEPKVGWTVRYWDGDRQRTGRVCYVGHDTFDVRWSYGEVVGTDTVMTHRQDWHQI